MPSRTLYRSQWDDILGQFTVLCAPLVSCFPRHWLSGSAQLFEASHYLKTCVASSRGCTTRRKWRPAGCSGGRARAFTHPGRKRQSGPQPLGACSCATVRRRIKVFQPTHRRVHAVVCVAYKQFHFGQGSWWGRAYPCAGSEVGCSVRRPSVVPWICVGSPSRQVVVVLAA